jgi:hypothetical protein
MFRNDAQLAAVCNAFLRHFGKPPLFTPDGPTAEAIRMRDEGCPWSSGERAFFRLAWTLWNDDNQVPFMDVIRSLDARSCAVLASFLVAQCDGAEAIDEWLGEVGGSALHLLR